jgi:hypothetical protein
MNEHTIRTIGTFSLASVSALFVVAYNAIKTGNALCEGGAGALPYPTAFYSGFAPAGLLVPFVLLGVMRYASDRRPALFTAARELGVVLSLAWSLGALWAWSLPYALPCVVIE